MPKSKNKRKNNKPKGSQWQKVLAKQREKKNADSFTQEDFHKAVYGY